MKNMETLRIHIN